MSATDIPPSDGRSTQALPRIGGIRLRDRVADVLEERILDGTFRVGSRMPTENELAAQLGVSRTVVRDALRLLEAQGLVEIRPGAGTKVREASGDAYSHAIAMLLIRSDLTLGDILDARETLEGSLTLVAAERHTIEDLARVGNALAKLEAAANDGDMARAARHHVAFHVELLRAARLPALDVLLRPIQQMMHATSVVPRGSDASSAEGWRVDVHRRLLDAVATRDRATVEAANELHWAYTRRPEFDGIRQTRVGDLYLSPKGLVRLSRLQPDDEERPAATLMVAAEAG